MTEHDGGEDSGPFCPHWGSPDWCTERCTCGHTCDLHWLDGRECNYRDCPCEQFTDAAPHRADTAFSRDIQRTTHPPKEPKMSNDTDGGKASERVRIPLGSPSQSSDETRVNPDRTELRSDATAEDRREGREPVAPPSCFECGPQSHVFPCAQCPDSTYLWCITHGDHVVANHDLTIEAHPRVGETYPAWKDRVAKLKADREQAAVPERTAPEERGWPTLPVPVFGNLIEIRALPAGEWIRHYVGEGDFFKADTTGDVKSLPEWIGVPISWRWLQPEPRRCDAPITDAGAAGDIVEQCGAVLGRDVHCDVCGDAGGAHRCYQHCAGVDHFKGKVIERGGNAYFPWKVVEIAAGRFRGQVLKRLHGEVTIIATAHGVTVEEVMNTLRLHLRQAEEGPPITRTPAARWQGPSGVRQVDALLNHPKLPPKVRTELVEEVIEWLRAGEQSWGDVYVTSYDTIDAVLEATKKWHDRQIAELFSRLAGAL